MKECQSLLIEVYLARDVVSALHDVNRSQSQHQLVRR